MKFVNRLSKSELLYLKKRNKLHVATGLQRFLLIQSRRTPKRCLVTFCHMQLSHSGRNLSNDSLNFLCWSCYLSWNENPRIKRSAPFCYSHCVEHYETVWTGGALEEKEQSTSARGNCKALSQIQPSTKYSWGRLNFLEIRLSDCPGFLMHFHSVYC